MIALLLIVSYSFATAIVLAAFRHYRQGSPIFWFPAALWLMAIGTFLLIDLRLRSDIIYSALFFLALVAYFAGAMLYMGVANVDRSLNAFSNRPDQSNVSEERNLTITIFVASSLITAAYYYFVGYNLFLLVLAGQVDNYSQLRLATYSEENYLAPGYVNQFKNVLLPLSAAAIAMWLNQANRKGLFYAFSATAAPFLVLALAGTGQRAYLVYTFAALLLGFVLHGIGQRERIKTGKIILAAIPMLALFGLMTGAYSLSPMEDGSVTATMLARFTSIQQESGLAGFRYIYPMPTAWFSEWWQGVTGILPGSAGSTLAHEIHEIRYGSFAGTAPISTVGSAYYNGGVLGVVLLFGLTGIAYAAVYKRFLDGPKTILRSLSYGFLFFYLSVWVAEGPVILLDNGVLTVAVFLMLAKVRLGRKDRSVPRAILPRAPRAGAG
jgi:oligosaccharide repeat unit polymerase